MMSFVFGFLSLFSSSYATPYHHASPRLDIHILSKNQSYKIHKSVPWKGHFSASDFKTSDSEKKLKTIKSTLRFIISKLPKEHTSVLDDLEVRNRKHVSRGMANSHKMIINVGTIDTQEELASIFSHEMGHIVDLGYLKGHSEAGKTAFFDGETPIYADDLSLKFYEISWKNATKRKPNAKREDFVSGYAMTNVFEDFAEHYIFYRLHGEKFRFMAKKSDKLQQKYRFFRTYVFHGKEFQTQKKVDKNFRTKIWDTTLVNYRLKEI